MNEDKKPFLDHLDELRSRLLVSIISVIVGAGLCYHFLPVILEALTQPVGDLVFLKPTEAFITKLKCALLGGIFLALPVLCYQGWRFFTPALYKKEKLWVGLLTPLSCILFVGGSCFAFYLVMPVALKFLLESGHPGIKPMIGFGYYMTFVTYFILSFGLIAQLPLVIFFLIRMGIVEAEFFTRNRRMAIIVIFCVAAMLTPGPDIFSQFLMAVPTLILYELSVFFARLAVKKKEDSE
jgi:sec-independent protein translocase protein TatC